MERDILAKKHINHAFISTHTLTWSVTKFVNDVSLFLWHFNSHAHVERDYHHKGIQKPPHYFNSHAHVERDE